jgi:hypothetical protein
MYIDNRYSNEYTESLEDFECFVRNIIDNKELTDQDKINIIKKQL